MHSQVLVIHPKDEDVDDIMYWYQEINTEPHIKKNDERCKFLLEVKEEEIDSLLDEIKEYLETSKQKCSEKIQYYSNHSLSEFKEKYEYTYSYPSYEELLEYYEEIYAALDMYEKVKCLPHTNYEQIALISEWGCWATEKICENYIPGKGYGFFDNPYKLWDYYHIVDKRRFSRGTSFLVSKYRDDGNRLYLDELSVEATVLNIKTLTRVWEYIIFSKGLENRQLYTTDTIRFDEPWNKHCVVDDLQEVLTQIQNEYYGSGLLVTALDFHW